jgi:hypothetical protein
MQKKKISLNLSLIEEDGVVKIILDDNGLNVLDFEHIDAPGVKVVGFNDREKNDEYITEFINREAPYFDGGAEEVLDSYIASTEKRLYEKSRLLRSEARKIAIIGASLIVAKKRKKNLNLNNKI